MMTQKKEDETPLCVVHRAEGKKADLFCLDDNSFMCSLCVPTHKGHQISDLESSAQKFRGKLGEIKAKNESSAEWIKESLQFWLESEERLEAKKKDILN